MTRSGLSREAADVLIQGHIEIERDDGCATDPAGPVSPSVTKNVAGLQTVREASLQDGSSGPLLSHRLRPVTTIQSRRDQSTGGADHGR